MSVSCFVGCSSYNCKNRRLFNSRNGFHRPLGNSSKFWFNAVPLKKFVPYSPTLNGTPGLIASLPTWTELESKICHLLGSKTLSYRLSESQRREDCRVVIFTDENLWCPYTKRVCFQLEEKEIPYRLWHLNMFKLAPWYKDINPHSQVPTAVIDGEIVYDSPVIMKYIEDKFPETRPLMPPNMTKKMKEDLYDFERLERRISNTWVLWFKQFFSEEQSLDSFYFTMDRVEEALHIYPDGPFFFGQHFSLVDILYAPFMDAIAATALYYKGMPIRKTGGLFPAIEEWFDALSQRPVYQNVRSDEMTIIRALPYQFDKTEILPQAKKIAERMDAEMRNISIEQVKNDPFEFQSRLLASSKLIHDRMSILETLSGSLGISHNSPESLTLDSVLRFLSNMLIEGYCSMQDFLSENLSLTTNSLKFLKDTIQVPKDLRYPASRQLIAYLNFILDNLQRNPEK